MQKLAFLVKVFPVMKHVTGVGKELYIQVLRGILEKKMKGINYSNFFGEE